MRTSALATAAMGLFASAASAADFTFDVPLRLQNVPSVNTARISCVVYRSALGTVETGPNRIGRADVDIPISGGAYDGNVTVEVDNSGIIPSSEARSYSCYIYALGTSRTGTTYGASYGNFRAVYDVATGHTLDRLVPVVRGSIPRPVSGPAAHAPTASRRWC